jgi:hypothetical protein
VSGKNQVYVTQGDDVMMKLGQMFKKERTHDINGRSNVWDGVMTNASIETNGFTAGTQVATNLGWRTVDALQLGDMVLTFDDGLQKVTHIERSRLCDDQADFPILHWPLRVPKGALGNASEMVLLPEQSVMVESDLGEAMFGDPFTLVPACALEGFNGVERMKPHGAIERVAIHFDTEQVVFANVGTLVHCRAATQDLFCGIAQDSYCPGYDVLSMTQAARFVAAMIHEEDQGGAWVTSAARATTSHVA